MFRVRRRWAHNSKLPDSISTVGSQSELFCVGERRGVGRKMRTASIYCGCTRRSRRSKGACRNRLCVFNAQLFNAKVVIEAARNSTVYRRRH